MTSWGQVVAPMPFTTLFQGQRRKEESQRWGPNRKTSSGSTWSEIIKKIRCYDSVSTWTHLTHINVNLSLNHFWLFSYSRWAQFDKGNQQIKWNQIKSNTDWSDLKRSILVSGSNNLQCLTTRCCLQWLEFRSKSLCKITTHRSSS